MNKQPEQLEWLSELNPQQQQAVTHGEGPLLVVAGAGSGKTRTLAYRVAYLISQGVDPSRILLLTFTRRSAQEMLRRAGAIATRGTSMTGRVWGGTFHATANRLLRMFAKRAGLEQDFTVMDQADARDLVNVIRHDLDLASRDKRFPKKGTCLDIYSRCVNGGEDLAYVLEHHFPWCEQWAEELKTLFKRYVERKQKKNILDYDDLLLYWAGLVEDKETAALIDDMFDYVLVDEYQDTNILQSSILQGMRRKNNNIMVVGDDAQSIYSFRAATVRNMLDFPKQFEGTTIITLEQNYRSVPPILTTTNRLIGQATERYTKDLWSSRKGGQRPKLVMCTDESRQDKFVIETILEHYEQGIPLQKQAVLFRASHLSDSLEVELTRRNIPYHKYGGLRFLEAAHVKDMIGFLRIAENPLDEIAWFRVLQIFDGVGPSTAERAITHVLQHQQDPRSIESFKAPAAAQEPLQQLAKLMTDILQPRTSPAAQVDRVRKFYDPMLEKLYDNPVIRKRDLENLEQIASGYKSRQRFLTDLTLDPPTSTSDLAGPPMKDEDWLVLSTIHSAKGCEWDVVTVIHAADGCLPSDMSTGTAEEIEEELRLTYVAMTRARDFLYITWPHRYYHRWYKHTDKHSYAQPCRFLTSEVCETIDHVCLDADQDDDQYYSDTAGAMRPDIGERLRKMWD